MKVGSRDLLLFIDTGIHNLSPSLSLLLGVLRRNKIWGTRTWHTSTKDLFVGVKTFEKNFNNENN